jgi:predicted nuclease of predicted toxin-antitoxin system
VRWLADENFNNGILRGVFRRNPAVDVVRVQDVGLKGVDDASVLAWAAAENRVLLTHDVSTVTAHAYRTVMKGECSRDGEWEGQVRYLPLR